MNDSCHSYCPALHKALDTQEIIENERTVKIFQRDRQRALSPFLNKVALI